MSRKYGDEQRKAVKEIREGLILQLEATYLKKFEELKDAGLGDGSLARITQLLLLSRDGAITPLRKEIEASNN